MSAALLLWSAASSALCVQRPCALLISGTKLCAPRRSTPLACQGTAENDDAVGIGTQVDDKELTGSIITFSGLSDEFKVLVMDSFKKRNRERLISGLEQYNGLEGMIEAYVEAGRVKGWTRAEAESEVVRYLQRRALRNEGGLEGDGQDNATFALLALLVATVAYNLATAAWSPLSGEGPQAASFQLPPW